MKQHVGSDTFNTKHDCLKGFIFLIMPLTEHLFCFYVYSTFFFLHFSGHLESKSSIKRVLAITAVLSLGYSITQVMTWA